MPSFPEIEPDTRAYDFGSYPVSAYTGFSGNEVRFSHGDEAIDHDLQLSFLDRNDTTLALIRDHYREQDGGHVSFQLPVIIWQGHSTDSDIVPIAGRWKYASAPEEQHGNGGLYDVTVRLVYVGISTTA